MTRKPVNMPASVATRLRNIAAAKTTDLALIYRRYAIERLISAECINRTGAIRLEGRHAVHRLDA
jgi:hypothetical protein